ncbi:MAG: transposase [Deltaproteobacteria bacterium]|jgi:hypothetical protein|nr:transposase [Deltaproteobacteria bacterium]
MDDEQATGHDTATEVPAGTPAEVPAGTSAEVPADIPVEPSPTKLEGKVHWDNRPSGVYGIYTSGSYQGFTKAGHKSTFHKDVVYLGKRVDQDIFRSRERGIFKFTVENGFEDVPNPEIYLSPSPVSDTVAFGHSWVCDEYLKRIGLDSLIDAMPLSVAEKDTLYALIAFKTFVGERPYDKAYGWFKDDYASILYPKAYLSLQSISDFLAKIGHESYYRNFFNMYIDLIKTRYMFNPDIECIDSLMTLLIDSIGLPNAINIPINYPCSNDEPAEKQIRMIYITDRNSRLPVYFRHVDGNIIDKSTLLSTINILESHNLQLNLFIMNDGYYSDDNVHDLLDLEIPFLTRVPNNIRLFTDINKKIGEELQSPENFIKFNDRYITVKKIPFQHYGKNCYAYICHDLSKQLIDTKYFLDKNFEDDDFNEKYANKMYNFGRFILFTNKDIPKEMIISIYYKRTEIEQIFNVPKNMTGLLPVPLRIEEIIRGHLFISFISSILASMLSNQLHKHNFHYTDLLYDLCSLKISIRSNNNHTIHELDKNQRELIEALDLQYPFYVETGNVRKAQLAKDREENHKRGRPKGSKGKEKYNPATDQDLNPNSPSDGGEARRSPGRPPGSKNKPKPATAGGAAPENSEAKRGPGRPPGGKNKPKPAAAEGAAPESGGAKRGPGRPPGSKNKPKEAGKIKRRYYSRKKN